MPHRKRRVWKDSQGSARTKVKKAGRKFLHLYQHLGNTGRTRDPGKDNEGRQ